MKIEFLFHKSAKLTPPQLNIAPSPIGPQSGLILGEIVYPYIWHICLRYENPTMLHHLAII